MKQGANDGRHNHNQRQLNSKTPQVPSQTPVDVFLPAYCVSKTSQVTGFWVSAQIDVSMDVLRVAGRRLRAGPKRHRRLHSHKLRATLVVLVVLAALGGGTDLAYGSLKSQGEQLQSNLTAHLQAGQRELEAGKQSLKQANAKHDASFASQAGNHFTSARSSFVAASRLADNSSLLRYMAYAPSVGEVVRSRHTAVDAVAEMGAAVSDAGLNLSILDGELIMPSSGGEAGRSLLTALNQAHTGLGKVRDDLDRARTAAAKVDVRVLPSGQQASFIQARKSIDSALSGFTEFERLMPILTDILGGNAARTYLIEQVNPIELRAGGGFIGSYSLIRADQGKLTVLGSGDSYGLAEPRPLPWQSGFIPLPTPYREVIPQVSWSFIDSNIYPDFPSNARAAETFVVPRLGMSVDAVIAIDYYAVAKMLELTGPLEIPGYGITADAGNFVQLITRLDYAGDPAHKAILTALSGPLMERVAALPPDRWPTLLGALNSLAVERHVQAYFNSSVVEAEIERVGWSGSLNLKAAREYMFEVEDNYGSKANYYLGRWYVVNLSRNGNFLHHKVTAEFSNNTPGGSYARTYYHADVRLLVSDIATSISTNLTPVRIANPAPPGGTKMADGWLLVQCCGSRGQAVFEYDTPWPASEKGPYQIYWQKQPGTPNDTVIVNWNGKTVTTDLSQDRMITLMPEALEIAAGRASAATLPSLDFGTS